MDGLKCKELLLSDTKVATDYFRLESEYYNAQTMVYSDTLMGKDVVEKVQYGTSKYCDESNGGYPVLRLNELNNGFIGIPQKYCHILSEEEFETLRLKKGDVLIIRTNGNPNLVGKSALVPEDTNYAYASYLYRVNTNHEINPETLVAYLNCKYGRYEIDKNSIKGNQTNFSPAKFRDIRIPKFGDMIQKELKCLFDMAYAKKKAADTKYMSAEQLFACVIGFDESILKQSGIAIRKLSQSFISSGRLDAEYYQPKYYALFDKLKKFPFRFLGGRCGIVNISKSIEPGSDAYQNEGIPFIRVSDISKYEITEPEIHLSHNKVENAESLYPQKDTILFSKDGSVGIAYKLEQDENIITSGALLHLTVKDSREVLPDYLTLVLNSPVVQMQAERDSNGAIIQHWKPSEIENVIIPVLDMDKQKSIATRVQESFALRRQSKELLEYAKRSVEISIEQGEDTALAWLKDRISQLEV